MHICRALLRYSCIALLAAAAACGPEVKGYPGATATVPLEKRYEELTPEQKKAVLSHYGNLPPGDEPPFPAEGIGSVVRQVSDLQRKRLAEGPTDMVVRVDAKGEPTSVAVYANADAKMNEALA